MRAENLKSLEKLGVTCHFFGVLNCFVGLVIAFLNLMNQDMQDVPTGIYIFFSGYGLVKVGKRVAEICLIESHPSSYF